LREFYFFVFTVLFDFKSASATVDGQTYHGSSLFSALAQRQIQRDPETSAPSLSL